jgi:IclR family transcriptional regulator, pca regulon regulatory protein
VVLDGDQVVIVARSVGYGASYLPGAGGKAQAAAPRVLAYGLHLGARLPAHATSTGRMLLACLPRAGFSAWMKSHELPRLTPYTVTEAKAFRALVAEARTQDYCVARQAHELGVFALAVPLRTMRGSTIAALNVVTAAERLEPAVLRNDLLPLLLDAARELRPLL